MTESNVYGRVVPLSESSLRTAFGSRGRPRVPSVTSFSTLRSRLESETDYGGEDIVHAPRPRHYSAIQPWLQDQNENNPNPPLSPVPNRVSSPSPLGQTPPRVVTGLGSENALPSPRALSLREPAFRQSTLHNSRIDSPVRRWVRWMGKLGLKDHVELSICLVAITLRWLTGLGGYSGKGQPPMFGDYEAQRHWMEITLHLPIREWYFYDLRYWGLDYPPLTAYISWLCGFLGSYLNPKWFALDDSRGFESPESMAYMRFTVVALDCAIFIPGVVAFCRLWWTDRSRRSQAIAVATILLHPALILIDNGHFQYNSVMLGLVVSSLYLFQSGRSLVAAVAFTLSLGFKQMALYYSPAVFAYCFGTCLSLGPASGAELFVKLGLTVLSTIGILLAPFLQAPFPITLIQPFVRMFPFGRGLFEDKVANFWCSTNIFFKWRESASLIPYLPAISLASTATTLLPSVVHFVLVSWSASQSSASDLQKTSRSRDVVAGPGPAVTLLPIALFNCSMAFYMFSFQVHEKSILLPLMPLVLLMSAREDLGPAGVGIWEWGVLFSNTALFSMWPLLSKDGLAVQYFVLGIIWNYLIGYNTLRLPNSFIKLLSMALYAAFILLHLAEAVLTPPTRYPDIFTVLGVLVCTPTFMACWIWMMKHQLEVGYAVLTLSDKEL